MKKLWMYLWVGIIISLVVPQIAAAHSSSSQGLTVTEAHIQAPFDKVPRLCNSPIIPAETIVRSTKNGNWSDPTVWSNGQVPGVGSRVHIGGGTTVTYDVNSAAVVQCIEVQDNGHLQFSLVVNTTLWLDDGLWVMPLGVLTAGTEAIPMPENVRAEIVFADTPLKTGTVGADGPDPQQYGKGLLVFGDVTMHGARKDPTFVRVTGDVNVGDTVVTLTQAPTGWKVGDKVVVPDTRHLTATDLVNNLPRRKQSQSEEMTIQAINGNQITLSSPLQYSHRCARDGDNATIATRQDGQQLCAHVGNLTRNVVLRSENPAGVAGHSIYFHRANVDLRYVQYQNMGRTTSELLHNSTFDVNAQLTQVGTNQIGRYALHMHHVYGQTPAHSSGYQFQIIGVVIDKNPKWGLTVHDTHYGLVKDVIAYKSTGGAIVTEDGSESYNVFDHNFVVGSEGVGAHTGRYDPEGRRGAAFWFHAMHNYVRNNVVADSGEGYPFYTQNSTGNSEEANKIMNIPLAPGNNTTQTGQFRNVSRANLPSLQFENNEAYSMSFFGLANWSTNGTIEYLDTSIWHTITAVHFDYPGNNTQILNNLIVRGDGGKGGIAITGHHPGTIILRNGDIQGLADVFNEDDRNPVAVIFEDSYFRNKGGIRIENGQQGVHNNVYTFRNLRFDAMPGQPLKTFIMDFSDRYKDGSWYLAHALHKETALVYDYQGIPGNNFRVYFNEQHPNVLLPMVCAPDKFGPTGAIKSVPACTCPTDGLTNGQCWEQHGQAMLLELPSCADTTTFPEVGGITCPFTGTEPPPPPPAPARLTITQPTEGSQFEASSVTVRYSTSGDLAGAGASLVVLQLDDGSTVPVPLAGSTHVFENVTTGSHVISGYLARADQSVIEGTSVSRSFTTTQAVATNSSPIFSFDQDISNLIATIGEVFTLQVIATDINGDTIELTASPLPVGAVFE